MIVVDTNVMVRREPEWTAPALLMSELHNVLVDFVRRGTATPQQAKAMSDDAAVVLGDRIIRVSRHQVIEIALDGLRCRVRRARADLRRSFGYPGQRGSTQRCGRGGVVGTMVSWNI